MYIQIIAMRWVSNHEFIRVKSVIIATAILVTNLWGGVTINTIDVTTPSRETYWDIQLQTPNLGKYKFVIQAKESLILINIRY